MSFFWQIVNSLAQGSLYALIALGYCLVFSVLRFINFAHGDFLMVGAYAGLFFSAYFPISQAGIILTIVASGIICALLGIFLQSVVYKPFMKNTEKNSSNLLVCAIGVSFLLQYGISAICSSRPRGYLANFSGEIINVFGIYTDSGKIFIFLFTIFVLISLSLFFKKTKIGLAIKGYSSDKLGGIVCGINGKKVCLICFLIGSFLAGACGVLYGSFFSVNPFMGTQPGIKAFAAAVIGGIGSIKGAFLGGLILGFAETFCGAFLSSAYKNSVAFFILIICLCFLPKGFFAKETAEYTDRA